MKRSGLLLAMASLTCVIVLVVCCASPYAPAVGGVVPIETLWEIEDARQESETPLVTGLTNHGVPLAYDAQGNTFYCTLGMENGENWPELYLLAEGADGVEVVFSDDYTYDYCSDAIREGYSYELMAYTDTEYSYFYIVFTGLPQVIIEAQEEITTQDSPIEITICAYGSEPVKSYARAHLRGASTLTHEKKSYNVEFTREKDGTRKVSRSVPGLDVMDTVNLNPMVHDDLLMREKLSWELYESIVGRDEPFGARMTQYAEVFLNGCYQGLYLMVEPMDCAQELGAARAATDSIYRTAVLNLSRDRQYVEHPYRYNTGYELYHQPSAGTADAFTHLQPWIDLNKTEDDAEFAEKGLACVDLQSMIEFDLFIQAAAMTDNVFNNMYIIAHPTAEGITYTFAPWDMDMTWGQKEEECGENFENWIYFPVADRLINLNAGGALRTLAADTWARMRAGVFNMETISEKMAQYTALLHDSGASARNAERWALEVYYPDLYNIIVFAEIRFALMDQAIEAIADPQNETIPFLAATQYEGKGTPMVLE